MTAKNTDVETRSELLVPAFTSRQRLTHWLFLGGWAAALIVLWSWWLQPGHRLDTFWFVVNSAVLAWVTLMPAYLLFVLGRGRVPNPAISLPPGRRVAMVVTKVPSEPWPIVQHTLLAMLRQPAARGGAYARQILSAFGSLISATNPVRSADRVNAKR